MKQSVMREQKVINIEIRKCGMIVDLTFFHQSSNKVNVSYCNKNTAFNNEKYPDCTVGYKGKDMINMTDMN